MKEINYNLLWSKDEYKSLLSVDNHFLENVNIFLDEDLTDYEKSYGVSDFLYNSDSFKQMIMKLLFIYSAIKKNYVLNGSSSCQYPLFSVNGQDAKSLSFVRATKDIGNAISVDKGNKEILLKGFSIKCPWINLEEYFLESEIKDMSSAEILIAPGIVNNDRQIPFYQYLESYENVKDVNIELLKQLDNLFCRKIDIEPISYKNYMGISLDYLVSMFEEYKNNLNELSEMTKKGLNTTKTCKKIVEFKYLCQIFIKSQFKAIDNEIEKSLSSDVIDDKIDIGTISEYESTYIGNTGRMFYVKSSTGEYYFKPAESKNRIKSPFRAYIQEAAYNIQRIINPERAIKCNVCSINGEFGAIQEKIKIDEYKKRGFIYYFFGSNSSLSDEILHQIFDEYLVDYCLCNYDSHEKNFIIDENGNLRGIDKEQAFRYIDDDKEDDMYFSNNYNEIYGENETIYKIIFDKIMSGKISPYVLDDLSYRAARIAQVPDEEYRNIFRKYAYELHKNDEKSEELLLDRIVNRKKNIVKKVNDLKEYLTAKYIISLSNRGENVIGRETSDAQLERPKFNI